MPRFTGKEKEKEKKFTFAEVKKALGAEGMTITKDTVGRGETGSGELRVTFSATTFPNMTAKQRESAAYYTNDLEDALYTGIHMRRFKK